MIHLTGPDGSRAEILPLGATLARLQMPHRGALQDCILAPKGANRAYLGVIAGRYANRIAGGRFTLDGHTYALDRNERGQTTLHGGAGGFSARVWDVEATEATCVTLRLHSPDGDQGFPGNLTARCTYTLTPATLRVELQAVCDRACPVNLTNHAYFKLDGALTTAAHRLTIPAETVVETDADCIPTGRLAPIAGTRFDYRQPGEPTRRIDTTYPVAGEGMRWVARLESRGSGLAMEVFTTKPAVHFYDGHLLTEADDGYPPHAGLCLETHFHPDSPNRPDFPDTILRPGQAYTHTTEFRFA